MKNFITLCFLLPVFTIAQSTSEVIIASYVKEIGGKDNWGKIHSFKLDMNGTSGSRSAKVQHYMLKPDKYKIVFNFPIVKRSLIYDGNDGSISENDVARPMPKDMQVEMREEPDFYYELIFYKQKNYQLERLNDTLINENWYWKFALRKSEKDIQWYYINKANNLLEIIEEYSKEKKHEGTLFKSVLGAYEKVNNILFPMKLDLYKNDALWIQYTVEKAHLNPELSSKDFIVDTPVINQKQDFVKKLLGVWKGTGTLMKNSAHFSMQWEQVLNDKFLKLTFQNRFEDKNGKEWIMNANGYYDLTKGKGYWFDSRGMMLPLKVTFEKNALIVIWGDDKTEQGKTVYTLNDDGFGVQDFIYRNGEYYMFGQASYDKQ